jgi:hypothetical protein
MIVPVPSASFGSGSTTLTWYCGLVQNATSCSEQHTHHLCGNERDEVIKNRIDEEYFTCTTIRWVEEYVFRVQQQSSTLKADIYESTHFQFEKHSIAGCINKRNYGVHSNRFLYTGTPSFWGDKMIVNRSTNDECNSLLHVT